MIRWLPPLVALLVPLGVAGALWWPVPLHLAELRPLTAFSDSHVWVFEHLWGGLHGAPVDPTCAAGYPAERSFRPIAGVPALLWMLLRPLTGALAAANVVQLLALPLSSIAAFAVLRRSTAAAPLTAALLAATYALCPNLLGTLATGEISNTQAWILPAWMLAMGWARDRWSGLGAVALVGAAAALTSPYLALALPLVAGAAWLVGARRRDRRWAREGAAIAALGVGLLPAWFLYRPDQAGGGASVFRPARADLQPGLDLPVPSPVAALDHLLVGSGHVAGSPFETVHVAALGLPLLAAAAWALWAGRRERTAAWGWGLGLAAGGVMLAMGPWVAAGGRLLTVGGMRVPTPVALLEAVGWPTAMGGLYFRYGVVAVLGLALLVADRLRGRPAVAVAGGILVSNLAFGLGVAGVSWPVTTAPVAGQAWLAERSDQPGPADDGAALELPLQGPTDAHLGQAALLRAVVHGRQTSGLPRSVVNPADPTRRLWMDAVRGGSPERVRAALVSGGVRLVLLPAELALHADPPVDRLRELLGEPDLESDLIAWDLGPAAPSCVVLPPPSRRPPPTQRGRRPPGERR